MQIEKNVQIIIIQYDEISWPELIHIINTQFKKLNIAIMWVASFVSPSGHYPSKDNYCLGF